MNGLLDIDTISYRWFIQDSHYPQNLSGLRTDQRPWALVFREEALRSRAHRGRILSGRDSWSLWTPDIFSLVSRA